MREGQAGESSEDDFGLRVEELSEAEIESNRQTVKAIREHAIPDGNPVK